MPSDAYEFGIKSDNLVKKGKASVPKGSGLGIEIDWDILKNADFYNKVNGKVNE